MFLRERDQVNNHFRIAVSLENRALALQTSANRSGIDEVAVVGNGDCTLVGLHQNGLRVEQGRVSRGGVARVADSKSSAQLREDVFREDIGYRTHGLVRPRGQAVRCHDARRFLPAMLQCVQSQVC